MNIRSRTAHHAVEGVNADGSVYTLIYQVGGDDDNWDDTHRVIQHLTDPAAEDEKRTELLGTIVDLVRYHFRDTGYPYWFSRAATANWPDGRIRTMLETRPLPPPGTVTWHNEDPHPLTRQTTRAPSRELARILKNMYHNEVLYANPDDPAGRLLYLAPAATVDPAGRPPPVAPMRADPVNEYHTTAYNVAVATPATAESAYNIPVKIEKDEDCALCRDDLVHGGTYSRPPCGHFYCRDCMSDPRLNRCLRCNTPFIVASASVKVYKEDEIEMIED